MRARMSPFSSDIFEEEVGPISGDVGCLMLVVRVRLKCEVTF